MSVRRGVRPHRRKIMTSLSPAPESALDWRQADDDVYVATAGGEYAGFVVSTPRGFEAHSAVAADLGVHASAADARSAVAAAVRRRPRRSPVQVVRSLRARTRGIPTRTM